MITRSLIFALAAAAAPAASFAQCDPLSATATETFPTCHGDADGALAVTVAGGDGAFAYAWTDDPDAAGATREGLPAGVYEVTITSCDGAATLVEAFVLGQPDPVAANAEVKDATCADDVNGAIYLRPTGGTAVDGSYSYDWKDQDDAQEFSFRENLSPGDYEAVVTDVNGCGVMETYTVTQSGQLRIEGVITDPTADGAEDGAIDVTVVGGINFANTYGWTGPEGYNVEDEDISDLGPGTYTIVVDDAFASCSGSASFVLDLPPPAVTSVATASCAEAAIGTIELTIEGGVAPYSVSWDQGLPDGPSQVDVAAGQYTASVADADGRQATHEVTVPSAPAIELSATTTSSTGADDGAIDLTIAGGSGDGFAVAWDNGATTQDLAGVAAGAYQVTVTDVTTGCSVVGTYTVPVQSGPLFAELSSTDVSCNEAVGGFCDASLRVRVEGGVAPYTLTFDGGDAVGLPSATELDAPRAEDFTNLCAGAFTAVVTDAAGATVDLGAVTFVEPSALTIDLESVTPVTTADGTTGSVRVAVAGGTRPYTYAWSYGATTEDATDVPAGRYSLTVTDARGCSLSTPEYAVTHFRISNAAVVDASCGEQRDGSIDISVSGAPGPFAYAWSDGTPTEDLRTAPAGEYSVRVTDEASGLAIDSTFVVGSGSDLSVTAELTSDFNGQAISCGDAADGSVLATVTGGAGAVTLEWNTGATTPALNDLPAGRYTVIARDTTGCAARATVEVATAEPLVLDVEFEPIKCPGQTNAKLTARASGGFGAYAYRWTTGSEGQRLIGLDEGTYSVTVTDEAGCSQEVTTEVVMPTELLADYEMTPATTISPGSITLDVRGGTQPYHVTWGDRDGDHDRTALDDLPAGNYEVLVTDANECSVIPLDIRIPNGDFDCFDAADVLTPGVLDGLNDVFRVNCIADFPDNDVEVFDRWGRRVYAASGYDNDGVAFRGLDGGGEPLEPGAYYYVLRYRDAGGAEQMRKGAVTVVR